jgi:hypothetical protein
VESLAGRTPAGMRRTAGGHRRLDQKAELPRLKAALRPGLKQAHSQVVQDVALRAQNAFDADLRRLTTGENPGSSRFRGKGRSASLTDPQWENGVTLSASGKCLPLATVGEVKIILHRPRELTPKTATIRRTATGNWFLTLSCDREPTTCLRLVRKWGSMWGRPPLPPAPMGRPAPTRASVGAKSGRWRDRSVSISRHWTRTKPCAPG